MSIKNRCLLGDCREVLATLPADSLDACVTDPPYGLGFMGQSWDHGVPGVEYWRAVWRVLKPGAHLLAFGGTRTYHRMACAIEDAGFEIRDQIQWIYGSGFPKSLDIAKAIDKTRTEDREPIRVVCRVIRAAMDAAGLSARDIAPHFDCHTRLVDHWAARDTDSQPSLPTWDQWLALKPLLSLGDALDAEVLRLNERKGTKGEAWQSAPIVGEYDGAPGGFGEHRFSALDNLRREASDDAGKWQGFGTALKPAHEPIVLARKPFTGTCVGNVQRHGTGALNIDGCRIGFASDQDKAEASVCAASRRSHDSERRAKWGMQQHALTPGEYAERTPGRWPANVIHDGSAEVIRLFPASDSSIACAPSSDVYVPNGKNEVYGAGMGGGFHPGFNDGGSVARFFYCPKADNEDRDEGVRDLPLMVSPFGADRTEGVGIGLKGRQTNERHNGHPTVKPTDLMRYLCRLVTPPGGVVLDPFAGSGSTGKAAALEGFGFVLIERESEYHAICEARTAHALAQPRQLAFA